MSRALGRGGLAHPAGILVVFVIAAACGRPRRTRLKQMTACAYFRTQLFPSDASSKVYRYFVSLQETLNSFLIYDCDPEYATTVCATVLKSIRELLTYYYHVPINYKIEVIMMSLLMAMNSS